MSILGIAYNNFKSNIRTYLAFFISMVFSVVVLTNFELLRYGDAINVLQDENKKFTLSVLVAVIMILSVFLFFLYGMQQLSRIGLKKLEYCLLWD